MRMINGKRLCNHPAHGSTQNVRFGNLEVIQQPNSVGRHIAQRVWNCWHLGFEHCSFDDRVRVYCNTVKVRRESTVSIVKTNDMKTPIRKHLAKFLFPRHHLGSETHNQQQCRVGWRSKGVVFNFDQPII